LKVHILLFSLKYSFFENYEAFRVFDPSRFPDREGEKDFSPTGRKEEGLKRAEWQVRGRIIAMAIMAWKKKTAAMQ
jgi:hypothetical protein